MQGFILLPVGTLYCEVHVMIPEKYSLMSIINMLLKVNAAWKPLIALITEAVYGFMNNPFLLRIMSIWNYLFKKFRMNLQIIKILRNSKIFLLNSRQC